MPYGNNFTCSFKKNKNTDTFECSKSFKKISYKEFFNVLTQNGLKKNDNDNYKLNLPLKDKLKTGLKYDLKTSIKLLNLINRTYNSTDIKNMHKFINLHNGKYSDYWMNNVFDLFTTYTLNTN